MHQPILVYQLTKTSVYNKATILTHLLGSLKIVEINQIQVTLNHLAI